MVVAAAVVVVTAVALVVVAQVAAATAVALVVAVVAQAAVAVVVTAVVVAATKQYSGLLPAYKGPLWPFLLIENATEDRRVQPRFLSWTRPSGPLVARLGRRDDAAGSCSQGEATTTGALPVAQSGA